MLSLRSPCRHDALTQVIVSELGPSFAHHGAHYLGKARHVRVPIAPGGADVLSGFSESARHHCHCTPPPGHTAVTRIGMRLQGLTNGAHSGPAVQVASSQLSKTPTTAATNLYPVLFQAEARMNAAGIWKLVTAGLIATALLVAVPAESQALTPAMARPSAGSSSVGATDAAPAVGPPLRRTRGRRPPCHQPPPAKSKRSWPCFQHAPARRTRARSSTL
jgi:hypothetical protein